MALTLILGLEGPLAPPPPLYEPDQELAKSKAEFQTLGLTSSFIRASSASCSCHSLTSLSLASACRSFSACSSANHCHSCCRSAFTALAASTFQLNSTRPAFKHVSCAFVSSASWMALSASSLDSGWNRGVGFGGMVDRKSVV